MPRRLLTGFICAVEVLLLGGCGGGDGPLSATPMVEGSRSTATTPPETAVRTPPAAPAASRTTRRDQIAALRPRIVHRPIALTAKRRQETAEYADRHYGIRTATIDAPDVIVQHYTVTPDFPSTYAVFAPDKPDVELNELPGLCSQFVIDRDGTIYQLTPVTFMCRHTVGLNYTAIGIEHVGSSDHEVLSNPAQMRSSLRLTRWLRCRSRISVGNVIGHSESLSSPYHRERVARLKTQTHADWTRADMQTYRRKLRALGACPR